MLTIKISSDSQMTSQLYFDVYQFAVVLHALTKLKIYSNIFSEYLPYTNSFI